MITLSNLLALDSLADAQPIAETDAARNRRVANVGVMDIEPLLGTFETFLPDEAVFTSLGFAAGNADIADNALDSLLDRCPTAIFIKDYFGYKPSCVIEEKACKNNTAIYRYRMRYLEDIITDIRLLLAEDDRDDTDTDTEVVSNLLDIRCGETVREALEQIVPHVGNVIQVVAFEIVAKERLRMRAARSSIELFLADFEQKAGLRASIRKYTGVLLAFCPLSHERDAYGFELANMAASACSSSIRCGISEVLSVEDGDFCVREALASLCMARNVGDEDSAPTKAIASWDNPSPSLFSAAFSESPLMQRAAHICRAPLRAYDERHNVNLEASLATYVACEGSVNAAAAILHQHPNSLRNRINRARELLDCKHLNDRALFAYLSAMFPDR